MNEKTDAKRSDILSTIALGIAAAGFVVTWVQPAGPLFALPFGLLAIWLRLHAGTAAEPKPARFPTSRTPR
jgi:hypothetical protein